MGIQMRDHYLITYDISNNKIRLKVSKMLLKHGERVQYSVFEVLISENELEKVLKKFNKMIDDETDSIRVYKLNETVLDQLVVLGIQKQVYEEDLIL